MKVRPAVRAGMFYEADPGTCEARARGLFERVETPDDLPETLYGGIVPHAGWAFSGPLAALTLKALHSRKPLRRVVFFGADHTGRVREGEVYPAGAWETPLGQLAVDEEIASALNEVGGALRAGSEVHAQEHSLEVQMPLVRLLAPEATIVPIAVPPTPLAQEVGDLVGQVLSERFAEAAVVGSTDLTHHGGHFGHYLGRGEEGVRATEANDERIIELMEKMDPVAVIEEAETHRNACGAGAIAATIAACRELGARKGLCLKYTNSYEIVRRLQPHRPDDTTVGYASVVFA